MVSMTGALMPADWYSAMAVISATLKRYIGKIRRIRDDRI